MDYLRYSILPVLDPANVPVSQSELYDVVDWDDQWDEATDRDMEDRWFDDEEESVVMSEI